MNLRKTLTTLVAVSLLAAPATALAGFDDSRADEVGFGAIRQGEGVVDQFQGIRTTGSLVDSIIAVINSLLVLAAIAAVVFMIIGGVRYVTSQGDEDAVAQAKNTVIYAVIGVIVIILAAVIVNFFIAAIR